MPVDWEKLHARCVANCTPGMHRWLGTHLSVSPEALRALGVGWAPVVEFSKKTSYDGWFTIPMRDTAGKVTGLALRDMKGAKVLYPGSRPGCFYVVNPQRDAGSGYTPGAHNWRRTMDAGVLCPVCGKPDGCLVSAEDPADPKAAICRVRSSPVGKGLGWLHILKPEGRVGHEPVLIGNGVVLVVEGMSDVAVAMDLGFPAVGRPSNITGLDTTAELVRGRTVLVIGENDAKVDGKWPGKDGAYSAMQTCKRTAGSVRLLFPPSHVKDLRDWRNKFGLVDATTLMEYDGLHGTPTIDYVVLPNDRDLTVADSFLRDKYYLNERPLLRQWHDDWYVFHETSGGYKPVLEKAVTARFVEWTQERQYTTQTPKGSIVKPVPDKIGTCNGMRNAALSPCLIEGDSLPCWLNGEKGPDPSELVVFNNGILHVPSFLEGLPNHLLDSTPNLFTTTALPIAFDQAAKCPEWEAFVESSLGDEPDKIALLQEWLGYCMTPDMSLHKMMFFRGPPAAGKGTVLRAMEALVGPSQTATLSLHSMAGDFGVAELPGKLICLITDCITTRGAVAARGLETLLNIVGGDPVSVNRKYRAAETLHLTARITIAANAFLAIDDHADALRRRLNIVEFRKSFVGKEDFGLDAKLAAEVPGIAIWALRGLRRLRENGVFTEPASMKASLSEWRLGTSPLASFLHECTIVDPRGTVGQDQLWACWRGWALEHRIDVMTRTRWINTLATHTSVLTAGTTYRGISLTPGASRTYLGVP